MLQVWVVKAGLYVSCMTWDRDLVVVGRGQSATYTAAETGHSTMISPLVFLYSRPGLEKAWVYILTRNPYLA